MSFPLHRAFPGGTGSVTAWCVILLFIFRQGAFSSPAAGVPDSLYCLALESISAQRVTEAFTLLDSALALDPDHGPSMIARGRLNLKLGRLRRAREDFNRAGFHKDDSTRSAGFLGRGDVFRQLPHRNLRAAAEYRKALRADSNNLEALYALAQTGFALEETQGYRMAAGALTRLVVIDPLYRDAYRLWRDKIFDHTEEEIREVGRRLDRSLAERPDTAGWRLDLAADCFELGRADSAMVRLAELERTDPGYKPWAMYLLRARCRLELGDTARFESDYARALEEAQRSGDYRELLRQAEPIFTPEESEKWAVLDSARQMAEFFRTFWAERDPDPLTRHNERLVAHYLRLREAEKRYFLFNPHSRFQTSRTYNRLLSPFSFFFDYDPDLFWNRCRSLTLDHRGLLFLRHGSPDRVTRQVTWSNPMEIWYYGSVHFLFERKSGAGDFIYTPGIGRGQGDINQAMATESFEDPVPGLSRDYYVTDFLAPDHKTLEVEFYQSSLLAVPPGSGNPQASVAIFDSTWLELTHHEKQAAAGREADGGGWIAVHQLTSRPGRYNYVIRMLASERRAVDRGLLVLEPYPVGRIALSGIILGAQLPETGRGSHRRYNVELMPRPSRKFRLGESIQVYLEVYGVGTDWRGERSFREKVTVGRLRQKPKKDRDLWEVIGLFKSDKGDRQRLSLTLTFNRSLTGPVKTHPEHFTLDTSSLTAGYYRLLIDVRDNSNGRQSRKDAFFEIVERER